MNISSPKTLNKKPAQDLSPKITGKELPQNSSGKDLSPRFKLFQGSHFVLNNNEAKINQESFKILSVLLDETLLTPDKFQEVLKTIKGFFPVMSQENSLKVCARMLAHALLKYDSYSSINNLLASKKEYSDKEKAIIESEYIDVEALEAHIFNKVTSENKNDHKNIIANKSLDLEFIDPEILEQEEFADMLQGKEYENCQLKCNFIFMDNKFSGVKNYDNSKHFILRANPLIQTFIRKRFDNESDKDKENRLSELSNMLLEYFVKPAAKAKVTTTLSAKLLTDFEII